MTEVQGRCDADFESVRDAFQRNFTEGLEVGASLAIAVEGEIVVDLWGGLADQVSNRTWEKDTITNVWSTTKTMVALCALLLVDRGDLDLDAPVARYWPEFAAAGKEAVLVRHILSHTSGLPGWEEPLEHSDVADFEKLSSLLAAQAPWWTPGEGSGYHSLTYGFLIGQLVRRITGQTLPEFFRQELADPLAADFQIVVPEADYARISPVIAPPAPDGMDDAPADPSGIAARAFQSPRIVPDDANTDWWRRAEIGLPAGMAMRGRWPRCSMCCRTAARSVAGATYPARRARPRLRCRLMASTGCWASTPDGESVSRCDPPGCPSRRMARRTSGVGGAAPSSPTTSRPI